MTTATTSIPFTTPAGHRPTLDLAGQAQAENIALLRQRLNVRCIHGGLYGMVPIVDAVTGHDSVKHGVEIGGDGWVFV